MLTLIVAVLAIIEAVVALDLTPKQLQDLKEMNKDWLARSNADPAMVYKVIDEKICAPVDETTSAYFKEVMVFASMLEEDGKLDAEMCTSMMSEQAGPDVAKNLVEMCKDKEGPTPDQTPAAIFQCMLCNDPSGMFRILLQAFK